jgi:hypothetical protein
LVDKTESIFDGHRKNWPGTARDHEARPALTTHKPESGSLPKAKSAQQIQTTNLPTGKDSVKPPLYLAP